MIGQVLIPDCCGRSFFPGDDVYFIAVLGKFDSKRWIRYDINQSNVTVHQKQKR